MNVPKIEAVNEKNFDAEVTNSKTPTLVDFWTPQCGPCKPLSVILEKFYETVEGKLKIVKVNAEECAELANRFGVRGVPTLMLFHHGKAIGVKTGVLLPPELRQWIKSCLPQSL
jgi:thioredoxin